LLKSAKINQGHKIGGMPQLRLAEALMRERSSGFLSWRSYGALRHGFHVPVFVKPVALHICAVPRSDILKPIDRLSDCIIA
jgi:hypothetical protein